MPERGEPVGLGQARLGRAPLGDVAPDLDHLQQLALRRRGSATRAPPPRPPRRPACGARRCAPAARPSCRQASVGQSPTLHSARRRRRGTSSRAPRSRTLPVRCRKASLAAMTLPLRVEHDDAVVDAVDDGLEPLALAAHLADQAGHRVGHGVELARQPGDGVGALGRDALLRGRRPRSGARSSRSAAAAAARTRGRRRRSAAISSSASAAGAARPSSAGRGSSSARISPASRSKISMPLMRCAGSWQRWQASRLRIGITVRRTSPSPVSMTRLEARCSGGQAVAGLAGRRAQVELARAARRRARVARDALPVEQHDPLDARLLRRSSRPSARSGCGRSRSSGARAPRGSARPARGRSPRSPSSSVSEVVDGVEVGARRRRRPRPRR